jgi:hypothetical protein
MRARLRIWLLAAIAALVLFSVPWYRETGASVGLIWGLPDWVAVALGCYVGVAILNSVAWLLTDMPEDAAPAESRGDPRKGKGAR